MRLLVEARPDQADEASRQAQAVLLAAYVKNNIGVTAEVIVSDPGKVERSAGKARRIVDLRPKD
jgi:phenylacetate-CoA ligase